jgi:DNA-binding transcriptional LysR family regulator
MAVVDANPTLDQLQVFLAVSDSGSFSAAARALNRAQSVVSYSIANLEAQLEVVLFDRTGTRQPRLTEAGRAMLTDARRIVGDLQVMRSRARSINQGLEAEVSLAISIMVPAEVLVVELKEFRRRFPSVAINLNVGELGMVMDMVLSGKADIGIGGAPVKQEDMLTAERIGHSFMVPVASPDHPLAQIDRPLLLADVREEIQLVVTDASGLTKGQDFNVLSYRTWRVSDIATKYQLIRGGLGWGGLPIPLVGQDILDKRLVALKLEAYQQGEYPLYAMRRSAHALGPAGKWLVEAFGKRLSTCPRHSEMMSSFDLAGDTWRWEAAE